MSVYIRFPLLCFFFLCFRALLPAEDMTDSLKLHHPRLLFTEQRITSLKQSLTEDAQLQQYTERLLKHAEELVREPLPVYEKPDGFRLLPVSRTVSKRSTALILAWHLTGKEIYAHRAKQDLLAVAAFPDWNPIHFLDTAEMAAAVGIGLDALWDRLTPEERETLRLAIQRHGILPYLSSHTATRYGSVVKGSTWVDRDNNWNLVCNGGILISALAAADPDDLVSMNQLRAVLAAAREQIPGALKAYSPDGGFPEGVMYWGYGSFYLSLTLDVLENALGSDLGLLKAHPELALTGTYILHAHGPQGWPLTYADARRRRSSGRHSTARLFFANRFDHPLLASLHHRQMALPENEDRITAWDVLWHRSAPEAVTPPEREAFFRGTTPLAVWRSAWEDPEGLYVSLIGGDNPGPHGHLDLGTFELRALGEHWVIDPGKDDYGLPGYWETAQTGRRWRYFRLGTQGHSVPMIGGRQQRTPARAEIHQFSGGDRPGAVIDLSDAYAPARVVRKLELLHHRGSVRVTDEITQVQEKIRWGLTLNPDATVEIDGQTATLTLKDKQLRVHALSPEGIVWTHRVIPKQPAGEKNAHGGTRLEFDLPPPEEDAALELSVWFEPVGETPLDAPP